MAFPRESVATYNPDSDDRQQRHHGSEVKTQFPDKLGIHGAVLG